MDQGRITYKLLPDSMCVITANEIILVTCLPIPKSAPLNILYLFSRIPYFDVNPLMGTVYVKNKTLLDREVRSLYSVTLQAGDSDNKTGSTVLEITLTDINDQYPAINRDSYLVFVEEGEQLELKIEVNMRK